MFGFRVLQETGTNPVTDNYESQTIFSVVCAPSILGAISILCCTVFFAFAIHYEWIDDLAPRAANRPKAVMKNAILHGIPERFQNKIYVYPFALLHWAYNLTYKDFLQGIPGTGTRKNGEEGPLLKTNLDSVIFLKYHTLLFKIGLLVGFLCLFVLLPVNITARCDPNEFGLGTCAVVANQTGFVQTTIAHIPDKIFNNYTNATVSIESISVGGIFDAIAKRPNSTNSNVQIINTTDGSIINETSNPEDEVNYDIYDLTSKFWIPDQSWRIMTLCICCVLIYLYTYFLLWREWVENVALRRAFFLEASHYGQRMIELNKLDLDFVKKKKKNDDYGYNGKRCSDQYERTERSRPPYLTHPEVRETPPSVGLYSVLCQLPNAMITYDTDGASSVERQLVATTKFFDMVVPPMPGFSSSVVAATMIPDAKLVTKCWIKWNGVEKRLQKLRRIRELIEKAEGVVHKDDENSERSDSGKKRTKLYSDRRDSDVEALHMDTNKEHLNLRGNILSKDSSVKLEVFKYEDFDVKTYAKSLGFCDEIDRVSDFVHGMGIEEFNVFASHSALLAGEPGIDLKVLNMYNVRKLRELENKIIDELNGAHQELIDARSDVVNNNDDEAVTSDEKSGNGLPCIDEIQNVCSMISHDADDEWNVAENEFDSALQMLGKDGTRKAMGMCSWFTNALKRILIGPDIVEFDSKYYGSDPENTGKAYKTVVDRPSYAVITFASRHSAIIARQCLADGVSSNNWSQLEHFPTYPLADAPAGIWTYPKGYMRPVTLTIPYSSKKLRKWAVYTFMVIFICSYTAIQNLINTILWDPEIYKDLFDIDEETLDLMIPTLSGATQTLLFAVCPQVFKFLAFKEGSATSYDDAEENAMLYFWYFYLVVRYLGQLVVEGFAKFAGEGSNASVEQIILDALSDLARTTPTILGPAALTWIIFAYTITWPAIYFLQVNNFGTSILRLGLINRILKGGGPGQDLPYRIYDDSAYVFSTMTTLAPVCPMVGPFAFMYFVVISPMVRWLVIFAYRPKFDSGGEKWPNLHRMIISSLLLGQVITGLSLLLKGNYFAGLFIGLWTIPTLIFNAIVRETFTRPFKDACLRFTGKIYKRAYKEEEGPDPWQDREEFRRWLVDCHKASYLPTCLSGGGKNLVTAEPAIVVPKVNCAVDESAASHYNTDNDMRNLFKRQSAQKGGIMRRQRFGI